MIQSVGFLNPSHPAVGRDLGDVYQLHRTVMRAFPASLPAGERVLFRLETDGERPMLTVQSLVVSPDWGCLPDGYWTGAVVSDDVCDEYAAGAVVSFRLRANPVARRNGRNVALGGEAEQVAWLMGRAGRWGFVVDANELRLRDLGVVTGFRPSDGGGGWITLRVVEFSGRLVVVDSAAFRQALREGVGRARAFGCGWLDVMPDPPPGDE